MKLVVTGTEGQVVRSLLVRSEDVDVVAIGRPVLDLCDRESVFSSLSVAKPDVIVSAAAYTAVDRAESEREQAFAVNATGAGWVAEAAAKMDIPLIHLSTDYVFDGQKPSPYNEGDPIAPLGVYGASKYAGEAAVAAATANHVILRTAWVFSPYGHNFLRTMLRLGAERDEICVVADQIGNPTSAHEIAVGILKIAKNLCDGPRNVAFRGVFHMVAQGEASWADFATEIFSASCSAGGPVARVLPIAGAQYSTPAPRPTNSRLDCTHLSKMHGVVLPDWRKSTSEVVSLILEKDPAATGGGDQVVSGGAS